MYLRLSFRNAKRSIFTYLLYIATMTILIAILCISNNLVVWGNRQAGFESASLPMIIGLIMVVLVNYINTFMLKQRAKELANYLLLGMEKRKLTQMFLTEFCCIGLLCFLLGALVGTIAFVVAVTGVLQGANIQPAQLVVSGGYSFLFFAGIEVVCAIRVKRQLYRLEIRELMDEKYRNQPLEKGRKNFWGIAFVISFSSTVLMLWGIVFLPENAAFPLISFISIPLLFSLFAFYKWLYSHLYAKRRLQAESLYQGNRLYHLAEMTKQAKTSPVMNGIFCTCLLFSAMAFVFGVFMLKKEIVLFNTESQQWMGFLQISMCVIFIVIYFSILSLQQIIDLQRQAKNIRILHYMGKNQAQIKNMVKAQVLAMLLLPTAACFALLAIGTPLINYKINLIFGVVAHNLLLKAVGGFMLCFGVLYLCYFLIVYTTIKRYIKHTLKT